MSGPSVRTAAVRTGSAARAAGTGAAPRTGQVTGTGRAVGTGQAVRTGTALPLRRDDVDTDQLAPARFVPYFRPEGFTNILFADWRDDPGFALNQPEYQGATVLVAGRDFGTGSSRESAVWALQSAGFQVVVASRFGDIFRGNATTRGLWTVEVDHDVIERLWEEIEADPWLPLTVDLARLRLGHGAAESPFRIDDPLLRRLLEPGDRIAETLGHLDRISAYEAAGGTAHETAHERGRAGS